MTLDEAIAKFNAELPGWWWSVGICSVSADASCAPDTAGPDLDLLDDIEFDGGFHADLLPPATPVDALLDVLSQAKTARSNKRAQMA